MDSSHYSEGHFYMLDYLKGILWYTQKKQTLITLGNLSKWPTNSI